MAEIELSISYTRTKTFTREVRVNVPDNLLAEDEDDRYDNIHEWLTDNEGKWAEDSEADEHSDEIEIDSIEEIDE